MPDTLLTLLSTGHRADPTLHRRSTVADLRSQDLELLRTKYGVSFSGLFFSGVKTCSLFPFIPRAPNCDILPSHSQPPQFIPMSFQAPFKNAKMLYIDVYVFGFVCPNLLLFEPSAPHHHRLVSPLISEPPITQHPPTRA
jgi:hypothetical protein